MSSAVCVGVDGCRAGWIATLDRGTGPTEVAVFRSIAQLLQQLPDDARVAVDMPIGLPGRCRSGGRGPEALVRPLLGARQSSVFAIPSRPAVEATAGIFVNAAQWRADHARASDVARETSDPPRGVSVQGYGLFAKIRELDRVLRDKPDLVSRVVEAHPELAFWRLNGRKPLAWPKKVKGRPFADGMQERAALLALEGLGEASRRAPPSGAGADDLLDALAMLTVARRLVAGTVERFPPQPACDAHGLPIAIHV